MVYHTVNHTHANWHYCTECPPPKKMVYYYPTEQNTTGIPNVALFLYLANIMDVHDT